MSSLHKFDDKDLKTTRVLVTCPVPLWVGADPAKY